MSTRTPAAGGPGRDPDPRVVALITEAVPPWADPAAIVLTARLREDLGLDSLARVALTARLAEAATDPDGLGLDEFTELVTVADVQNLYHRLRAGNASGGGRAAASACGGPPVGTGDPDAQLAAAGGSGVSTAPVNASGGWPAVAGELGGRPVVVGAYGGPPVGTGDPGVPSAVTSASGSPPVATGDPGVPAAPTSTPDERPGAPGGASGTLDRLVRLLGRVVPEPQSLGVARFDPSAPLRDLGLPSMVLVDFLVRIEREFAFTWDEDTAPQTFGTLTALARHIDDRTAPPVRREPAP
ncbi:phosphopantetheine-binding protein [Streptomyces sp. NPDC002537]